MPGILSHLIVLTKVEEESNRETPRKLDGTPLRQRVGDRRSMGEMPTTVAIKTRLQVEATPKKRRGLCTSQAMLLHHKSVA